MRRIVANLLAEDDLARLTPSREVLRTAARRGSLLRAFAREGDRLWLPAPVDPGAVEPVPGLPVPVFESGPLEELEPAEEVLAWCETPAVAAHRRSSRTGEIPWDAPLWELVWHLPAAPPEVAARVSHRGFHLRVAQELGCALPGARMVESLADLDRILHGRDAPAAWVLKAPFSAAGRSRAIERNGPPLADSKQRRTVERLFARHGPLLFEPWMDRIADYGCAALLTGTELRVVSLHRQRVDAKGQFAGVELSIESLPEGDRERLAEVTGEVALALRKEGYRGPFGIDAWKYRRADGSAAFHPLGEINPRMTFGLVQRALEERVQQRQFR